MAKFVSFLAVTVILTLLHLDVANGCICTREMNPVCGSNGVTYGNPCQFECAQKLKSELTIRHSGRCKKETDEQCFCTKEMRPVCGSDGKTYSNICEFTCAQKKRTDLTVSHQGQCVDDKSKLIL